MGRNVGAERERVGKYICTQCGDQGDYTIYVKSSLVVEIGVWVICIILAYFTFGATLLISIGFSLWRYFSKEEGCPKCKGPLIEIDSPKGKKTIKKFGL